MRRALIVRGVIGYVAAGTALPRDPTLQRLERWVAPLHRRWDAALATSLRERFCLDMTRRLASLSRGEYMKAALLCALAAQPQVLLMDEPLTGIDAVSRDEIARGLLANAATTGTTILIASHDIAEIEAVLSHVAILTAGNVHASGSVDDLRFRYRRITVRGNDEVLRAVAGEQSWMDVNRSGRMKVSALMHGGRRSGRAPTGFSRIGVGRGCENCDNGAILPTSTSLVTYAVLHGSGATDASAVGAIRGVRRGVWIVSWARRLQWRELCQSCSTERSVAIRDTDERRRDSAECTVRWCHAQNPCARARELAA